MIVFDDFVGEIDLSYSRMRWLVSSVLSYGSQVRWVAIQMWSKSTRTGYGYEVLCCWGVIRGVVVFTTEIMRGTLSVEYLLYRTGVLA